MSERAPAADRWLRRALEPEPDAVARIVAAAWAGDVRAGASRRGWGWAAAAVAVAVAAAFAVSIALLLVPPAPQPPADAVAAARLRISNESGPIVVTTASGHRWIQLRNPGGEP